MKKNLSNKSNNRPRKAMSPNSWWTSYWVFLNLSLCLTLTLLTNTHTLAHTDT